MLFLGLLLMALFIFLGLPGYKDIIHSIPTHTVSYEHQVLLGLYYLPSSNGGLFAYQYAEMYRHTALLDKANGRRIH